MERGIEGKGRVGGMRVVGGERNGGGGSMGMKGNGGGWEGWGEWGLLEGWAMERGMGGAWEWG